MPGKKKQTKVKVEAKQAKIKQAETKPAKKKSSPKRKKSAESQKTFPIVGMGASAGGLEALQKFFQNVPQNPGMAFVVVSHLDPSHASLMTSLLQKHTRMRVVQVEDGMKVEPNHAYIIPPDRDMGIQSGVLQLLKPTRTTGARAPVNYFFRHLAEDQKERAVGIILSGMGTDGTLGIRAIKSYLGMTMAQEPTSAKYDGMPNSAIETGISDYILTPEKMPAQLIKYAKRFGYGRAIKRMPQQEISISALRKLYMLLRSYTGHDFSMYKESTIVRRIQRRMNVHHIDELSKYLTFLQHNREEANALFKEFLIGVTSFFRDPEAFEVLKKKAIPILVDSKPSTYSLRMWVPGCSTGEEAYSLAMIMQEFMDEMKYDFQVQIFASDIDNDSIETARSGLYPGDIAGDVSPERLERFFQKQDNSFRINSDIRDMLIFASQSVVKDPPFTRLDLICCRNLLIYLNSEMQKRLIPLFHYSLNPGGILFLGPSEAIGGFMDLFTPIDGKWKIYSRKATQVSLPRVDIPFGPRGKAEARAPTRETNTLPQAVERHLMEHFTPAAVVVDQKGNIAYIHGRTGKYLEPAPGSARINNLLEMARADLKIHLPGMLRQAGNTKKDLFLPGVPVKQNGDPIRVNVRVKRFSEPEIQGFFMVLFEEQPPSQDLASKEKKRSPKSDRRAEQLEEELKYVKETLRTVVEQLETANEELKSSNEEYASTNEELQSSNEELNSSKEELQSVNEELETVNAELQDKNLELLRSYNEMKSLLDSMDLPTLFLDDKLCIQRFTSRIGKVVDLIDSDVGRPLVNFVTKLNYKNLIKDAKNVLETLIPKEVETWIEDGQWYTIRIKPYRSVDNVIAGLVITFIDIHMRKIADLARTLLDNIFNTVRQPLVVLDRDLRVVSANDSFCKEFSCSPAEAEGRSLYDLGNKQWDIPELRSLLEKVIPKNQAVEGFEVDRELPGKGRIKVILNARKVKHQAGAEGLPEEFILLAMEQVTQKK